MADTKRENVESLCGWVMVRKDQFSLPPKPCIELADVASALLTERDAAQAEVARLTAALAEAETRGAERILPLINAAAGATTAIAHALDDGDVADNAAGNLEASLSALNSALEPAIRALPLPPRERDGQEG